MTPKDLHHSRLNLWALSWNAYERDLHRVPAGTSLWIRLINRLHNESEGLLERITPSPGTGESRLSTIPTRRIEVLDLTGQDNLVNPFCSLPTTPTQV